jgi:hypothetical protein
VAAVAAAAVRWANECAYYLLGRFLFEDKPQPSAAAAAAAAALRWASECAYYLLGCFLFEDKPQPSAAAVRPQQQQQQ